MTAAVEHFVVAMIPLGTAWDFEAEYAAQQTDTEIVAAPVAGVSIYITDVYVNVNTALTVYLKDGAGSIKWAFYGSAKADGVTKWLRSPIILAAAKSLTVSSSGAGTFFIAVSGYTK